MTNNQSLNNMQHSFVELMAEIVEASPEEQIKITELVIELGVNRFLQDIEEHDLSIDVKDKLKALRNILRALLLDGYSNLTGSGSL